MTAVPRRGLRRRRSPDLRAGCLLGAATLALVGLPCTGLVTLGTVATSPGGFALAVVLALLCTVPYTLALLWLDRNEQEPLWLLGLAFMWGALVATPFSGFANDLGGAVALGLVGDADLARQLAASFVAPITEELMKGTALIVLFVAFRDELDNVLDGLVYGAMIGLGFAFFENILYYVSVAGDGVVAMVELAWVRGVLSGIGSHAAYSGLVGVGLGLARVLRRGASTWLVPPLFLGLAMAAHFTWNTFGGLFAIGVEGDGALYLVRYPLAVVVLQLPFLVVLAGVVLLSWRHEERVLAEQLADEPADVATPDERQRLVPARRRALALAARLASEGPAAAWRQRQLDRALVRLAFAKWHHAGDAPGWHVDDDADVRLARERVREARRA